MPHELLVALNIKNDTIYTQYRNAMTPLLTSYGGGFRYDFKIAETLKNEEGKPINRVFIIYFKDKNSMVSFFNDPIYLKIKSEFFETSVDSTTIIAEYTK